MVEKNKIENNKKKKVVGIAMFPEQHEMLKSMAKEKGFSQSNIVVMALEEYAKKHKLLKK